MSYQTEEAAKSAKEVMRAINAMSLDNAEVGRVIANDHRTLQQSFMGIVVGFINEMADHKATGRYDPRNEAAVIFADRVKKTIFEDGKYPPALPFI